MIQPLAEAETARLYSGDRIKLVTLAMCPYSRVTNSRSNFAVLPPWPLPPLDGTILYIDIRPDLWPNQMVGTKLFEAATVTGSL